MDRLENEELITNTELKLSEAQDALLREIDVLRKRCGELKEALDAGDEVRDWADVIEMLKNDIEFWESHDMAEKYPATYEQMKVQLNKFTSESIEGIERRFGKRARY